MEVAEGLLEKGKALLGDPVEGGGAAFLGDVGTTPMFMVPPME